MKLNNFFIKLLETFGTAGEIYNAMDSGDSVEMVRAADRAILMADFGVDDKKSLDKSKAFRDIGNDLYKSGKYGGALVFYNKAIAYALPGTLDMMLAISNRSAVLFIMRSSTCISDINSCLTMGSPPHLTKKLKKRMVDAQPFAQAEILRDMIVYNQFISKFFKTDFVRRKDVNCASSDVAFSTNDGVKQITAKRQIPPGKIVAIETAFVTCNSDGYNFQSCYYCNKLLLNPIPCTKCCYAMFCTNECRKLCMRNYHNIECQIVDLLEKIYSEPKNMLTIRAAIKLSLKLGWDGFIAASENIGSSRMKVASTRETYSVDEPLSMLSFDDSQELMEGRMFNASVMCAIVLKLFDKVPNYFPKEAVKRAAAKKAMTKIMFHLNVHFTNNVYFSSSAYEFKSDSYSDNIDMHTLIGWFSMTSKLKHSCQPNLLIVGLNDHIALLSLRTIEKGEELSLSFMDHFLDYERNEKRITNLRASNLFLRTRKMCSCYVCTEEWSISDIKYEPMTTRQTDLYRRFHSVRDISVDKDDFKLVCEVLDTFSVRSKQYNDAYRLLKRFLCMCQCKLTSNECYSESFDKFTGHC